MKDLIKKLKKNDNYKLYICKEFSIVKHFGKDNIMSTSDDKIKCLKSEENSYIKFFEANNLNSKDCIFIKKQENVNKLKEAGYEFIKFDSAKSLNIFIKGIEKSNQVLSVSN